MKVKVAQCAQQLAPCQLPEIQRADQNAFKVHASCTRPIVFNRAVLTAATRVSLHKRCSSGATLSFTVRSKGDGGQPCCLIMQKVAVHFRIPCCPQNTVNTVVVATNGKNSKTLRIPLFLACEAPKTSIFTVLFVPKPSKKLAKYSQTDAFGAVRASPPSSTTVTTASI